MKDLNSLTRKELQTFFDSFDRVLCDVDGVLWLFLEQIPGTQGAIHCLKQMGKHVAFVSNNTTKTQDFYVEQLQTAGFEVEKHELVTPILAMISHLEKLNFTKEIYVIGMDPLKNQLANAGFKVAKSPTNRIGETFKDFISNAVTDDEDVGAVIVDVDINLNYMKLQKAATYLKRSEILFIAGTTDKNVPVGANHVLIGPGYFNKILEDMVGRKAYALAKPSIHFNEFLVDKFAIKDSSRVLFVGDSISEDMSFATNGGYQKLLVLSGLTKIDAIKDWTFPEKVKPDYYVDSLKTLHDLVIKHKL